MIDCPTYKGRIVLGERLANHLSILDDCFAKNIEQ